MPVRIWLSQSLRRFDDASGVSAVEFSLLVPVLLCLLMIALEIPRAYMLNKRVHQVANTLADIVSRRDRADIQQMQGIAGAIAQPYSIGKASIILTAAGVYGTDSTGTAKVCSSAQVNGTSRPVGSLLGDPPDGLTHPGDRYVMVEVKAQYETVIPIAPWLTTWNWSVKKTLPVRDGKVYNGQPEIVILGGQPCPLS